MIEISNSESTSSELSIDKSPINGNSINLEGDGIPWGYEPVPVTPESIAAHEKYLKKHRDRRAGHHRAKKGFLYAKKISSA